MGFNFEGYNYIVILFKTNRCWLYQRFYSIMTIRKAGDEMNENMNESQKVIAVGLYQGLKNEFDIEESMNELSELVKAAGGNVLESVIQNKDKIEAATYIGTGKVEEIRVLVETHSADLVIFNDELSGAQIRNLEALLDTTVLDRTALILDIFAQRAQSKIAKLQVELAQLKYRLPRLIGLGGQMSRTGGGIGTRGPGEQKLEIDRRRIQERIDEIRRQIREAEKNREVQRKLREKREVPIVALVGYTNSGKSTLLNQILKSTNNTDEEKQVFEKDMLFATLDTFSRRIVLDDKKEFILTDTVGFVSKLPHSLVEAFKATLEEALAADLLIHVIDASNQHYSMQSEVTHRVLKELKADHLPMVSVYNKIDKVSEESTFFAGGLKISAKTGFNIDVLIDRIKTEVFKDMVMGTFLIPYSDGATVSYLCSKYKVEKLEYLESGTLLELELEEKDYNRYQQYLR